MNLSKQNNDKSSMTGPLSWQDACLAALGKKRDGLALARKSAKGMSLIEILVVLAIIGLIMGGVAVVAGNAFSDAQGDTAKNDMVALVSAAEMFKIKKRGQCPKSVQELKDAGISRKANKDPWGTEYKIICPGEHSAIDIVSAGKDKSFDTEDDIHSWDE